MPQNPAWKIGQSIEVLENQQEIERGKTQEHGKSTEKAIFGGKAANARVFRVPKTVLKRRILGPNSSLSAEHNSAHLSSFHSHLSNRIHT